MSLLLLFQGSSSVGYNETGSCASDSGATGTALLALSGSGSASPASTISGIGLVGLPATGSNGGDSAASGSQQLSLIGSGTATATSLAHGAASVGLVASGSAGSSPSSSGLAIVSLIAGGAADLIAAITGTETATISGIEFNETGEVVCTTTATGTETSGLQDSSVGGGWNPPQWQQWNAPQPPKEYNVSGRVVCRVRISGAAFIHNTATGQAAGVAKISSKAETYSPAVHGSLLVALTMLED